jgi:hypothetical protein
VGVDAEYRELVEVAKGDLRKVKQVIQDLLIPVLIERGFEQIPLSDAEQRSEIGSAYPFGRFRRRRDDGYDLILIQFARYRPATFTLDAGVVPLEGFNHPVTGHVKAEDAWPGYLARHYSFYDTAIIARKFGPWRWPGDRRPFDDAEIRFVVSKVKRILPEVEIALREGRPTAHAKLWGWAKRGLAEIVVSAVRAIFTANRARTR